MRYLLNPMSGVWSLVKQVGTRLLLSAITIISCTFVSADIQIKDGHVRGLPPGQSVTAAFMKVINNGDKPVEIIFASTDGAKKAEIHAHLQRDGMMRMEKVESVIVPANGEITMKPGGYHLMLLDLHKPLREGDSVKVQLLGKNGKSASAQLPVRSVLNEHKHQHH